MTLTLQTTPHQFKSGNVVAVARRRKLSCVSSLNNTTTTTKKEPASPIIQSIVSAATEALRLIMRPPPTPIEAEPIQPYKKGDVQSVLNAIKDDFDQAYFVTGVLTEAAYDDDCYFADPTVNFTGRDLWKANLQLLVPFLVDPSIELYSLRQLETPPEEPMVIFAEWRLKTGLNLFWKPYIDVLGDTTYTLAYPDSNRVVKHVERWNIDGVEALKMVLLPGRRMD